MPITNPPLRARHRAFTLVELLTVIAIIGILATILIPTVQVVRRNALKTKTKVQLNQWAGGMENFHTTYGFYPKVDGTSANGGGGAANVLNASNFAIAMTGKNLDGTALATGADRVGNSRLLTFYSFADTELDLTATPGHMIDAFGNTEIAVLYDKNGDGIIKIDDVPALPSVNAVSGGKYTPSSADVNLTTGIRAGVILYSPGAGNASGSAIDSTDVIFSWK